MNNGLQTYLLQCSKRATKSGEDQCILCNIVREDPRGGLQACQSHFCLDVCASTLRTVPSPQASWDRNLLNQKRLLASLIECPSAQGRANGVDQSHTILDYRQTNGKAPQHGGEDGTVGTGRADNAGIDSVQGKATFGRNRISQRGGESEK